MDPVTSADKYSLPKPTTNGGAILSYGSEDVIRRPRNSSNASSKQNKVCCFCFKTTRHRRKQFVVGFLSNIGIFSLLLAYTFLGSFIFLAIEGDEEPRTLPDRSKPYVYRKNRRIGTDNNTDVTIINPYLEARAKTVENIWEITVSLNILYRENWTRLAAIEISKFQDELVQKVTLEMAAQYGVPYQEMALGDLMGPADVMMQPEQFEWSLAMAFFYSLTVLTTIGYGSIAPKTALGKAATIAYALFGIPLTLLYLSSIGSLLSKLARSVFSRALCCCLCSNCGYCCYDEKRMAEKERRMKLKRQHEEMASQRAEGSSRSDPCYVVNIENDKSQATTAKCSQNASSVKESDTISWPDTDSKLSIQGLSILAPVLLCLCAIFIYILIGTIILFEIDGMPPLDGFYFCFMSLSTIGFGNILPGTRISTVNGVSQHVANTTTIWFCSVYIMTGLALTAMCFSVIHEEIIHRIKHKQKEWTQKGNAVNDEANVSDPYYMAS